MSLQPRTVQGYSVSRFSPSDLTANHVYDMIMKNFLRVYEGETDTETGDFQRGNKAPWGLYVHAAWFFGQPYHWEGYKMFLAVSLPAKDCVVRICQDDIQFYPCLESYLMNQLLRPRSRFK